ncbi:MAG: hypothetical protein ACYSWO_27210 [Planctomycetota bacterium]|jgi:hypothetical protein
MSKRKLIDIGIVILIAAFLCAMIAPSIHKTKQGAHVVQQMAAFREVCQHIKDHNEPPAQTAIAGINYDPNALGYADKSLFNKKYFLHEVVTYGDGRIVLLDSKGKIIHTAGAFSNDSENIFRKYTSSEPYIHRR